MAPKAIKMAISQEGFDAAVKENMEDFDMDLAEAVQDAVKTFQIQGADLSEIIEGFSMEQGQLPKATKEADHPKGDDKKGTELLLPDTEMEQLSLAVSEDNTLLIVPAHQEQQLQSPDVVDAQSPEIRVDDVVQDKEKAENEVHSPSDVIDAHSAAIITSHVTVETGNETGIVTDGSIIGKPDYVHPVIEALKELEKSLLLLRLEDGSYINWEDKQSEPHRVESLFEASIEALEKLAKLCVKTEPENAQIAVKNGGVEASIQAYYALQSFRMSWGSLAFRVLLSLLTEEQGKDAFLKANGPKVALEALAMENVELYEPMNRELSCVAANAMAMAATKNETVKERFMDLGADAALVQYLKNHAEEMGSDGAALQAACDAIRSLTVADDDRPAASNAFKNAMKIAKAGAMDAFLEILPQKAKALPILPSLCLTLKSLAVNDEICRGFAEEGGLAMVLEFLDYASKYPNKVVGRTCCALLSQLAGSDANKEAVVKSDGLQKIIHLMKTYSEEPSVLQEGFAAIATLTLRSPQHVTKAVEAGALDLAVEMMEAHPGASHMLRQASQMVRNLNVRNPENRPISLEKGLEPLLRRAKDTHEICKDVASAALRDLGLEDYL